MALFGRKKQNIKNDVRPRTTGFVRDLLQVDLPSNNADYARLVYATIFEKVRGCASNVVWSFGGSPQSRVQWAVAARFIKKEFEKNIAKIWHTLNERGQIGMILTRNENGGFAEFVYDNMKQAANETYTGDLHVLYDPAFLNFKATKNQIALPYFCALNSKIDADCTLTQTYGAMGILTPKDTTGMVSFEPEDRENIQREYLENYGAVRGRWKMLITPRPMEFQPINLPIKDLDLASGIERNIKSICGLYGLPYELLPMSGQSTYANRAEAQKEFKENTIFGLENLLFDWVNSIFAQYNFGFTWNFEDNGNYENKQ